MLICHEDNDSGWEIIRVWWEGLMQKESMKAARQLP